MLPAEGHAGFDAQAVGADIGQHHFLECGVACLERRLYRRTLGDHLVGVEVHRGDAPEQPGDHLAYQRHARAAADQQHFVEIGGTQAGVAQGPLDRRAQALDQRCQSPLQLVLRNCLAPFATVLAQAEVHLGLLPECMPHPLGLATQALDQQRRAGVREALRPRLTRQKVLRQGIVEVLATEKVVAGAGAYFHHAFEQLEDGHVEGAAAQVEDQDGGLVLLVQAVGQCRGGGFVDQLLDLQPGQFASHPGGLALGVAEVGRHADHRFADRLAEGALDVFLEAAQHQRRQLFGAQYFVAQANFVIAAHVALEQRSGQMRMGLQTFAGNLADKDLAIVIEADHARREQLAKGILDQARRALVPDGNQTVGGTQVDSHDHADATPVDADTRKKREDGRVHVPGRALDPAMAGK